MTSGWQAMPHIVFILADDLGWNMTGWQGNNITSTPFMDTMVQGEALQLQRHYAQSTCGPSRAALLTGRERPRTGIAGTSCLQALYGSPLEMTLLPERLQAAGYYTALVGKWDHGMARMANLPVRRGFNTSFGYLSAKVDHWTQEVSAMACQDALKFDSAVIDYWVDEAPAIGYAGQTFGDLQYTQRAVDIINEHDPDVPLFLYLALQAPHDPFEAPDDYEIVPAQRLAQRGIVGTDKDNLYNNGTTGNFFHALAQYAMSTVVDRAVENVTAALRQQDMWTTTLMVLSSDNGGTSTGSNNYDVNLPLQGFKSSNSEGGVRVAGFVSGGYLPSEMRGTSTDALMHISDWYATFCFLAGVEATDEKAEVANLPAVTSVNQWPLLSGQAAAPARTELWLEVDVLYMYHQVGEEHRESLFKYVAARSPTASDELFDVLTDPGEETDVSDLYPRLLDTMESRLKEELLPTKYTRANYTGDSNDDAHTTSTELEADAAGIKAACEATGALTPLDAELAPEQGVFVYLLLGVFIGAFAVALRTFFPALLLGRKQGMARLEA